MGSWTTTLPSPKHFPMSTPEVDIGTVKVRTRVSTQVLLLLSMLTLAD
jgi:hypothetical protein